jgi:hypothetical protein
LIQLRACTPRSLGLVVDLLVAAAGDVVREHPTPAARFVEAREEWHHYEARHRGGQVGPHHLAELVRLALEAQRVALHLLVVLELGLEQPHHLDCRAAAPAIATPEKSSAGNTFSMRRLAIVNPAVARRSPAITTPPAKRIASTVVPCVTSIGCVPPPVAPAPGSWCGATCRSRPAKDGPGSRSVEKRGNT